MEKKIASCKDYAIFLAGRESLLGIAQFVVKENYTHHSLSFSENEIDRDIQFVLEEEYLYDEDTQIFIARDLSGEIIGCIRTFHWDRYKTLPIEKVYGINPLCAIHAEAKYSYWHIGRFAVKKNTAFSTLTLFKQLMALAVKPIVEDKFSYMIAEIDYKLLKVMMILGFSIRQMGQSINYLTSETVPVCSSKRGLRGFYSKYGEFCRII